jgi:hypothetical protein
MKCWSTAAPKDLGSHHHPILTTTHEKDGRRGLSLMDSGDVGWSSIKKK